MIPKNRRFSFILVLMMCLTLCLTLLPATVLAEESDLSIAVTATETSAANGSTVSWIVTVKNTGSTAANEIGVQIDLPVQFLNLGTVTPEGGTSWDGETKNWAIPALTAGTSSSLKLETHVQNIAPNQVVTVSASIVQVDGSSVTDPVPSGNASITGRNLALQLSNMVDAAPTVGGKVTCTLMISSNESFPVEEIQVEYPLRQQLGDKLRIEKIAPETGSYDPDTGLWDIPSLPAYGRGFLAIEAVVLDAREANALPLSARIIRAGGTACSFDSADTSLWIQQPNATDYGSLAVTNTVTGVGADEDAAFPFEAVFESADGTAMHSMGSYTKGSERGQFDTGEPFAFTLRHDETILLQVPDVLGYYTITETDSRGYLCSDPTATGTIQGSEPAAQALFVNEAIPVTSISLYPSNLSLCIGNSMTLTAAVSPDNATNKTVFWSSNNSSVATVSGGTVTAVGVGIAVITATTQDGSFTDTCTVTVTQPSPSGDGGTPTHSVSLPGTVPGGEITVKKRYAEEGETFRFTVTPDEGYELDSLSVTDSAGREISLTDQDGGEYSFEMPAGQVTIEVSFREIGPDLPFTDVPENYWACDEIAWAYESGYMSGTAATAFNPGGTVSRQQVWMILARMAGAAPADMAGARTWAVASGISDGTDPGGAVTRQQLAALLYRYAVQAGYDVSVGEDTNILSYTDAFDVAEYAVPAMQWACGAGILNGTGDGSALTPQGTATRAQLAAMLCRWLA